MLQFDVAGRVGLVDVVVKKQLVFRYICCQQLAVGRDDVTSVHLYWYAVDYAFLRLVSPELPLRKHDVCCLANNKHAYNYANPGDLHVFIDDLLVREILHLRELLLSGRKKGDKDCKGKVLGFGGLAV